MTMCGELACMHGPILQQSTDERPDTHLNASSRQEPAATASHVMYAQSDGCPSAFLGMCVTGKAAWVAGSCVTACKH